jgi:hypothetical protein
VLFTFQLSTSFLTKHKTQNLPPVRLIECFHNTASHYLNQRSLTQMKCRRKASA